MIRNPLKSVFLVGIHPLFSETDGRCPGIGPSWHSWRPLEIDVLIIKRKIYVFYIVVLIGEGWWTWGHGWSMYFYPLPPPPEDRKGDSKILYFSNQSLIFIKYIYRLLSRHRLTSSEIVFGVGDSWKILRNLLLISPYQTFSHTKKRKSPNFATSTY